MIQNRPDMPNSEKERNKRTERPALRFHFLSFLISTPSRRSFRRPGAFLDVPRACFSAVPCRTGLTRRSCCDPAFSPAKPLHSLARMILTGSTLRTASTGRMPLAASTATATAVRIREHLPLGTRIFTQSVELASRVCYHDVGLRINNGKE